MERLIFDIRMGTSSVLSRGKEDEEQNAGGFVDLVGGRSLISPSKYLIQHLLWQAQF